MEIPRLQKYQLAKTRHVKTWKLKGRRWLIDVVKTKKVKTGVEKKKQKIWKQENAGWTNWCCCRHKWSVEASYVPLLEHFWKKLFSNLVI